MYESDSTTRHSTIMSTQYTNVELLDIANDQHMHTSTEVSTAIDLLESRGVISTQIADQKRGNL
jgi:hypothetical protein